MLPTTKFNHSVKVPRIFKIAAKNLQLVQEKGASLKGLIFAESGAGPRKNKNHPRTKALYALVITTIQNADVLDQVIRESEILLKERLDPWMARVLIAELIWGKKTLPVSDAKPIAVVLAYQERIMGILREAVKSGTHRNEPRQNKAALKPRYVRINTLLMSVDEALAALGQERWCLATPASDDYPAFLDKLATLGKREFLRDYHVKELFAFPPRTEFFKHELYLNGTLILQDKATCLAPHLLNPTPGSSVLDMCAAPGIKTTQLAAIMENKGTLYAVERHATRYKTLCDFVPRHGVTCVKTIQADASTITPKECQNVEYILVDPTCSGSGMDRPKSAKEKDSDPNRLKQLAAFQVILLERAMTKFPSVKRVVYSTCSIHPEENEQVVEKALALSEGAFTLVPALESWPRRGSSDYEVGPRCLLTDPDEDMTTGFFVAVFEKKEGKRKQQKNKRESAGAEKVVENGGVKENKDQKRKKQKKDKPEEVVENGGNKDQKQKKHKKSVEEEIVKGDADETKHKKRKKDKSAIVEECVDAGETKERRVKKHKKKAGNATE